MTEVAEGQGRGVVYGCFILTDEDEADRRSTFPLAILTPSDK